MKKKLIAMGCSLTLVISMLAGCGSEKEPENPVQTVEKEAESLGEIANLVSHSSQAGEEETVYAMLDADGNTKETIVSTWLKNQKGEKTLKDTSDLQDITLVKGDGTYTASGNQLTWENDGSDIYYQGTSTKALPVQVKVAYELDGKKVQGQELKNVSGHLKIQFSYENQTGKEVTIKGKKETIYQPYVMVSGLLFENEKAQNVTVDHGGIINSGDSTVAFGIGMPGLQESLGIDSKEVEIPKSVLFEADVTDFTMPMTLTFASNRLLEELGLDEVNTVDELKADMKKMTDGMDEILDGATELKKGAKELETGAKKLETGTSELKNSMPELTAGITQLDNGSGELYAGLKELKKNNKKLSSGSKNLADGLNTLKGTLNDEETREELNALVTGAGAFSTGMSSLSGSLDQMKEGYTYKDGDLKMLIQGLTQYANALEATNTEANRSYASAIKQMIATYEALYDDVAKVDAGANGLKTSYDSIYAGIQSTKGSIDSMKSGVDALAKGATDLQEGLTTYTEGVSKAAEGSKKLDTGISSLYGKVPNLTTGINKLHSGAGKLATGTKELAEGSSALKKGIVQFNKEGIQKLADLVNQDLDTYLERLKAMRTYSESDTTYGGCESDISCSVKYIYKTEEIK